MHVCMWIYKVHLCCTALAFFISLPPVLFVFGSCLFLFALDWLQASVCVPKQPKDVAANKEDHCLSLKTRTVISGGVSMNDLLHIWVTCSVAVSFHPASQRIMRECHQMLQSIESLRKTRDKINSSLEWNYCRSWAAVSHLVLLKPS